jgi:ubiquinone/menaquinone biosynthesis C-methylase UbiE
MRTEVLNFMKVMALVILCFILRKQDYYENFETKSKKRYIFNKSSVHNPQYGNVYDKFYANVYDDLFVETNKTKYELSAVLDNDHLNDNSTILDVGCGTGKHINLFKQNNIKCVGVDVSKEMLKKAKTKYPGINNQFHEGDVHDAVLFQPAEFTHITCFSVTFYFIRDKVLFLKNCIYWLKPKGYLILHLHEQIAQTKKQKRRFKVNGYPGELAYMSTYTAISNTPLVRIRESFQGNNELREHENVIEWFSDEDIIRMSKDVGFILHRIIKMVDCEEQGHHLYVFQKPF